MIRIVKLDTEDKLVRALIKCGKTMANRLAFRSYPCPDSDVIAWYELLKAYNIMRKGKKK